MDVGSMLGWVYLRLCCLPGCQSLHKSRGIAGINSAPFVSAPGAAASLQLPLQQHLCCEFVQGFHTRLPQLQVLSISISLLQEHLQICHGTYYRSFTRMDHQEMHKIGADMARIAPLILQHGGIFWVMVPNLCVWFLGIRQSPTTWSG